MTAASAEIALRICYSARAIWQPGTAGEAQMLCAKLANWETLTIADGVDHPVQMLLALVVADDVPDGVLGTVPLAALLNEVCARQAEDDLRRIGAGAGRARVAAFLGITLASAPRVARHAQERRREAVMESCRGDYTLNADVFDFKRWVRYALEPWTHAVLFARRLRETLRSREGGWSRLARDMEAGPAVYADVIAALQKPPGSRDTPAAMLGVRCQDEAPRILATVVAQAFLHPSPQLRRTVDVGGSLEEPLGDILEDQTLRALCVKVRMAHYDEMVCSQRKSIERARVNWDSAGHAHGLCHSEFWELWKSSYGEDARRFLASANAEFQDKHSYRLPS